MKIEIKEIKNHLIKWISVSQWIDEETGELLTKHEAKNNYITIKKTKHANIEKKCGTITHTNICRRSNQTRLFE